MGGLGTLGVVRQRRLLVGIFLDTFGTGAFYPLTFLYISMSTSLSLGQAGALMTIAGLAALPLTPLTGTLVDRLSAKTVLVGQNVLSAVGYSAYLVTGNVFVLGAGAALVVSSERFYWSAWPVFVAQTFDPRALDRSYAVVNSFKSASLGLGALAAAAALATSDLGVLRIVLLGNVASSLITAAIFRSAETRDDSREEATPPAGPHPWQQVVRDRSLLLITGSNAALTFAWLIPTVVLPVYLVERLDLPAWMPSLVFVVNTVLTVSLQTTVVGWADGFRRTRVVGFGALLFVAAFVFVGGAERFPGPAVANVALGVVLFSLAEIVCGPVVNSIAVSVAPADLRGRYMSVFQSSWMVSAILGPVVIGTLLDHSSLALWVFLGMTVSLGGAGFLLSERTLPAAGLRLSGEAR